MNAKVNLCIIVGFTFNFVRAGCRFGPKKSMYLSSGLDGLYLLHYSYGDPVVCVTG